MFTITRGGYIGLFVALACGVWVGLIQRPEGGVKELYDEWHNALHIGGAYFLYQVVDDVPHLIAGHSPEQVSKSKEDQRESREISRKDIPGILIGRAVNHFFRGLFVIVLSKLVLGLTNH